MANAITIFRMAASIVLLFCPVFSPAFYVFYIMAGLSDMLDGFVARKTNTVSRFGAKLDTIADYMFVAICLIKLLPVLSIPSWLYGWIGIIALIKVVNIISGFAVQKKFVAVHSVMNKATGALLFLLPLTIPFLSLKYSAIVVCALATFAAIQEGHLIRTGELLQCLEEGLYPSWDAQNMNSVYLAEKLGYEFDHEYTVYEVSGDEISS